jgi:hypothetical protein
MIRTALALGIVLEVIEILRRAPTWLLILVAALVAYAVVLVIAYFWWIACGLAAVALWLTRHRIVRQRT